MGEWHRSAVLKGDDDQIHLYIDGSLEPSSDGTAADFGDTSYAVVLASVLSNPRYLKDLMDGVRFWNYTRTKEGINKD